MTRSVHAFVLGLTLSLLASPSFAASFETKGQPEPNVTTMTTYGVDVATRSGLKSVLPPGWQLFIHRSVTLPETMTWKLGEQWTAVLANFSAKTDIAVLIDWDARTVFLRTPEIALEEGAKKQEIAQAATTPLPRFSEAVTSAKAKERAVKQKAKEEAAQQLAQKQKEAEAAKAEEAERLRLARQKQAAEREAELAALANVPVIRTNPTPSMVEKQAAAAKKRPVAFNSTAEFRYTKPVALNKPMARSVAQAIANRFNLRMVWAAPEIQLRGPVTLLAESPEQDTQLLQKALGVFSPVIVEVSIREKVLRVVPKHLAGQSLVADQLAAVKPEPSPVPEVSENLLDDVDAPSPAAKPSEPVVPKIIVPKPIAPKPKLTFDIAEKEPLEDALVRFTRAQKYTLEWKVTGGFEASRNMHFEGSSIAEVLSQLLPKLGLSADVYTREKHVVVRPGDAAQDR